MRACCDVFFDFRVVLNSTMVAAGGRDSDCNRDNKEYKSFYFFSASLGDLYYNIYFIGE